MKGKTFESEEADRIELELAEVLAKLARLRAIMRARKVAGLLSEDNLREFMEVDAQVENVTRALQRYQN